MSNLFISRASNITDLVIFIIVFVCIAIIVFLIIFFAVLNSIKNKRVLSSSTYIKQIETINKQYKFFVIKNTFETKTFHLNTKRAFDNFDYYKKRSEYFRDNLSYFQQVVEMIDSNNLLYRKYKDDLNSASLTTDPELASANKMSLKSFNAREKKLGERMFKRPQTTYSFRIYWEYTSPAGRNHYSLYHDCSLLDIKNTIQAYMPHAKNDYVRPKPQRSQDNQYYKPQSPQKTYSNDDIDDVE